MLEAGVGVRGRLACDEEALTVHIDDPDLDRVAHLCRRPECSAELVPPGVEEARVAVERLANPILGVPPSPASDLCS